MSKARLEGLIQPIARLGPDAWGETVRALLCGFIDPYRDELALMLKRARPDVAVVELTCRKAHWVCEVYADPGHGVMAKAVHRVEVRYLGEVRPALERWLLDTARAGRS